MNSPFICFKPPILPSDIWVSIFTKLRFECSITLNRGEGGCKIMPLSRIDLFPKNGAEREMCFVLVSEFQASSS